MQISDNDQNRTTEKFKTFLNQGIPRRNEKWTDTLFPPNDCSLLGQTENGDCIDPIEEKYKLINKSEIEWKRLGEIFPEPVLIEDTLNINKVKFGKIGYIYYISALAALSQYPNIFDKIILTKEYNPDGYYKILLFIDGEYQIVLIDDYFPCIKGSNILYFVRPNNFEFWAILIEKAWAKVNGGYQNIINAWPKDLFKALTGCSCEEIIHKEYELENFWDILKDVDGNNGLICSSTINNEGVEENGLIKNHIYVMVETVKIEVGRNQFVYLCKLRDPINESNWKGDWSENSKLWTEKIKRKIIREKIENNEGEFWISLEDLMKYFFRTDLCQVIYDGYTNYYEFKDNQLNEPQIFNFYVQEEGLVSVSIMEKNWRFHRELRNVPHPTSLIIAEYDPKNKIIKNEICQYDSHNDVEITRVFQKGYYVVWLYKPNNIIDIIHKPDLMKIKFSSDTKVGIKYLGKDNNFCVLQEIIYQCIKNKNEEKIQKNKLFYETENSFNNSGIGYLICINYSENKYQEWKIESSEVLGFYLLNLDKQTNSELVIGPGDYNMILGIKKKKFGEHWFNLNIEATQSESNDKEIHTKAGKFEFGKFFSNDYQSFEILGDNPTFNFEELKKVKKYSSIDHWKIFLESLKDEYSFIKEELMKLESLGWENLNLVQMNIGKDIYIGEADYIIKCGRGAYIFGESGIIYIGYWENGQQFKYGKVFDKEHNLCYEGGYKHGLKEGKGSYHYSSGESYDGTFVNGQREGNGTFYWRDGTRWEGKFRNNEMNGQGIYYEGDESYSVTYKDGDLIEN